jgi:hypothetical protein
VLKKSQTNSSQLIANLLETKYISTLVSNCNSKVYPNFPRISTSHRTSFQPFMLVARQANVSPSILTSGFLRKPHGFAGTTGVITWQLGHNFPIWGLVWATGYEASILTVDSFRLYLEEDREVEVPVGEEVLLDRMGWEHRKTSMKFGVVDTERAFGQDVEGIEQVGRRLICQ